MDLLCICKEKLVREHNLVGSINSEKKISSFNNIMKQTCTCGDTKPNIDAYFVEKEPKPECDHIIGFTNCTPLAVGLLIIRQSDDRYNISDCDYKCPRCPECGEKLNLKKDG